MTLTLLFRTLAARNDPVINNFEERRHDMARALKVRYFKANLENKPGALLKITEELKKKNVALTGLWGFATHGGAAELYVVPKNPAKLRNLWSASGMLSEEGSGFWLKGVDRTGALNECLKSLANAGVNVDAIDAIALGGRFGSFVWVAPDAVDKAAEALKAK